MTKVHFKDLTHEGVVAQALLEVVPRLAGTDITKELGITGNQLERLEKFVTAKVLENAEKGFINTLLDEDSVEIKETANIYIYASQGTKENPNGGYKTKSGAPKRSIKAKTRTAFNKILND